MVPSFSSSEAQKSYQLWKSTAISLSKHVCHTRSIDQYLPSNSKKLSKIMELPMNITTDCYRAFHRLHITERGKKTDKDLHALRSYMYIFKYKQQNKTARQKIGRNTLQKEEIKMQEIVSLCCFLFFSFVQTFFVFSF